MIVSLGSGISKTAPSKGPMSFSSSLARRMPALYRLRGDPWSPAMAVGRLREVPEISAERRTCSGTARRERGERRAELAQRDRIEAQARLALGRRELRQRREELGRDVDRRMSPQPRWVVRPGGRRRFVDRAWTIRRADSFESMGY